MSFLLYLAAAAWQDARRRTVSGYLFLFFFTHFLTSWFCQCMGGAGFEEMPAALWYRGMIREQQILQLLGGMLPGIFLLLFGRCSGGALGTGDGLFFLISGIYLGFWRNFLLLCVSLFLCSLGGLCWIVWGRLTGRDCRKKTLPLLVFVLVPGIWIAVF